MDVGCVSDMFRMSTGDTPDVMMRRMDILITIVLRMMVLRRTKRAAICLERLCSGGERERGPPEDLETQVRWKRKEKKAHHNAARYVSAPSLATRVYMNPPTTIITATPVCEYHQRDISVRAIMSLLLLDHDPPQQEGTLL